ncbi:MAG: pilus assembly protein PilM [Planctomycetota bacterium]|nr:pilus assembly protein PilM [Planctomycetota bacterium]
MHWRDLVSSSVLPIGVDIGAGGVRLAQLRRRGRGLELVATARVELGESRGGPACDEHVSAVVEAVRSRVEGGGFRGRACVVSLDDRLVRVRSVRHPRMPDDELDRAVALDAPGRLGFVEGEAAEVGWLRAGEVRQGDDVRDEIILVGTRREPVERLVFALAAAGLRPVGVEPGFVAAARSFSRFLRRTEDQNTVRVVVDVGVRSTGVTIIRGQSVVFHKPLELGGELMTRAAAERLGVEPAAIEEIRRQRAASGSCAEARVDRALFEAVRPVIMDVANEVALCLRYFGVSFRGLRPDRCVLVGGEANEPRLAELVGEAIHLPTVVGVPLEGVTVAPESSGAGGSDAGWAVATGLSLRALRAAPAASATRRRSDVAAAEGAGGGAASGGAHASGRPGVSRARRAA